MKRAAFIAILSLVSFLLLTAEDCDGRPRNTTALDEQAKTEVNQRGLMEKQPPPRITWSLERDNLIRRFKLQNDRAVSFYMYVFIEGAGEPIGYYQINKVSSVDSQLTNPDQIVYSSASGSHVLPSPAEDGSYGTNGIGVFGFTPEEVYIETNMKYLVSTVPAHLREACHPPRNHQQRRSEDRSRRQPQGHGVDPMAKKQITYWKATEVREIADTLIPDFHEHLNDVSVYYIFRSEASEKKGQVVLGSARKVAGLNAYLANRALFEEDHPNTGGSFYVIEIGYDTWLKLTGSQRIALVDHELSHIGPDGLESHDVEEFSAVVARHGLWRPNLEAFKAAAEQTPLFEPTRALIEKLRPKKGSGIDSITFSTPGREPVTLTAQDDVHH